MTNLTLKNIKNKYIQLTDSLSQELSGKEIEKISKQIAEIEDIYNTIIAKETIEEEIGFLKDINDTDIDPQEIKQELIAKKQELDKIDEQMQILLLPKDDDDKRNAIIEVRAAAGGDEAGLFAAEIFHMYQKYAQIKKWKFEIDAITENGIGSYKEAIASISGSNVFKHLKFESGVHRVQRIPKTESQGRVHTSTVTVAILPEVNDNIEINIPEKDLRIDTFRSSGAGGQHVNTTDSAVRITHLPTGLSVVQQQKSQHNNKVNCMRILKSKLYDIERQKKNEELTSNRKSQIGSGDRSEKIRTYNFPQSRITDHRINFNYYKLNEAITEGKIDTIIETLITEDIKQKLAESKI